MPKIFISYRRKDSAHVSGRIYDILVDHFGKDNVLKDIDNIRAGIDFREEISRMLNECDVVLAIIGPQWLGEDKAAGTRRIDEENDPVRVEIEFVTKRNIPIIPILFDGMKMENLEQLPDNIATLVYRNGFEIRADPFFKQDLELVIRRLKLDFQTEADREQQQVQERLGQLEREKKLRDDRRRLEELEAEHQHQIEQEQLARVRAEQERQRQLALAEQERQRQEEAERQAKAEQEQKEKKAVIAKQKDAVSNPIAIIITIVSTFMGGYIGYLIWNNALHDFGGNFVKFFLIGVLGIASLFAGFFTGVFIGGGFSETPAGAIITTIGLLIGGGFGAIKGASIGETPGLAIGLFLGVLVSGLITGTIASGIRKEKESPWYIKGSSRIIIE